MCALKIETACFRFVVFVIVIMNNMEKSSAGEKACPDVTSTWERPCLPIKDPSTGDQILTRVLQGTNNVTIKYFDNQGEEIWIAECKGTTCVNHLNGLNLNTTQCKTCGSGSQQLLTLTMGELKQRLFKLLWVVNGCTWEQCEYDADASHWVTVKTCRDSKPRELSARNGLSKCRDLELQDSQTANFCENSATIGDETDAVIRKNIVPSNSCPTAVIYDIETGHQDRLVKVDVYGLGMADITYRGQYYKIGDKFVYRVFLDFRPRLEMKFRFNLTWSGERQVQQVECFVSSAEDCQTTVQTTTSPATEVTSTRNKGEGSEESTGNPTIHNTTTGNNTSAVTEVTSSGDKGEKSGEWTGHPTTHNTTTMDSTSDLGSKSTDSGNASNFTLPVIIGVVVGAIVIINIAVIALVLKRRRSKSPMKDKKNSNQNDEAIEITENDIYGKGPGTYSAASRNEKHYDVPLDNDGPQGHIYNNEAPEAQSQDQSQNGRYTNKDGLVYQTVEIVANAGEKQTPRVVEDPIEYAIIKQAPSQSQETNDS